MNNNIWTNKVQGYIFNLVVINISIARLQSENKRVPKENKIEITNMSCLLNFESNKHINGRKKKDRM